MNQDMRKGLMKWTSNNEDEDRISLFCHWYLLRKGASQKIFMESLNNENKVKIK